MSDSGVPKVLHVDQVDMRIEAKTWDFAVERRAQIDALFAQMRREKPALFNGRVLLMHRYTLDGGTLRGHFLETDYASFAAWQRWGRPPAGIFDCFAAAAILAADGAFLLGLMGPHTFNAGQIYFPCGTPDPSDVKAGKVDFEFSVKRELHEETGLDAAQFTEEPGWSVVFDGGLICATKVLRSELPAEPLRARILTTLAAEQQPELADIRIVRGPADFDPAMRGFVKAFLAHRFGRA
jgi:8-oxo-dGTP pyrophosphatase MutT (NUDIX family)